MRKSKYRFNIWAFKNSLYIPFTGFIKKCLECFLIAKDCNSRLYCYIISSKDFNNY